MNLLRKILFPIVPIYYVITWIRNFCYDHNIFKSVAYDFPVIAVGNLSVGGTGKSPMIEYLIKLLKKDYTIATLSRGYKRETKGFQMVATTAIAKDVGDEPLQFKKKFPEVLVAVDADRRNGIARLRQENTDLDVLLLDDAYQHRKVKAGLYVLLTAYYDLYFDDIMLPTGNLREPIGGMSRAAVIIVTKCPPDLSDQEQNRIIKKIKPKENQLVLFSTIAYSKQLKRDKESLSIDILKKKSFTLVTGIANPKPLLDYYNSLGLSYEHLAYPDHHHFTDQEIKELQSKNVIITTEKDYVRLANSLENDLWYQPIEVQFLNQAEQFDQRIKEFVKSF